MQKDYTKDEQNVRYNLRQFNKALKNSAANVKVRLGEFCIFIDDQKYMWANGELLASNSKELSFLQNLVAANKLKYTVKLNQKSGTTVANANVERTTRAGPSSSSVLPPK